MSLPLFECGASRLDHIVKPGMLCAFDFDGTLAPIVKEPERASIPAAVSRRLVTLSECAQVAIITGRSVEDIGLRLDFLPDYVAGNHGIEGIPGWEHHAEGFRQLCQQWEQRLSAALNDRGIFEPGIWIENKTYSLSIHYRMVRDRESAEMHLGKLFAGLMPEARVIGGKCVFNLLPSDAMNKGTALERLLEASGATSVLYVGDDATDEDVFRLQRDDLLTVRIERSVDTAAEFHLNHRLEMVQLLDELIGRLSATCVARTA
ncbi:trehalose-phosphatase [Noviherbaspirillum agri]